MAQIDRAYVGIAVALLIIWADRRWRLRNGRVFALYVALYTFGRFWIESLRIDSAHKFFGLRLNDWASILVFAAAVAFFFLRRPGTDDATDDAESPDDTETPGDNGLPDEPDRTLAT